MAKVRVWFPRRGTGRTYGKSADEFNALLANEWAEGDRRPFSVLNSSAMIRKAWRKRRGARTGMGRHAWVPTLVKVTENGRRETAKVFNHAGEVLAKHGIKFITTIHG